jgi:hypothetical protein
LRSGLGAALAAAVLLAPAAVAQAATVDVSKRCYAEAGEIDIRGTGFTPNGGVRLSLERATGDVLEATADPVADQQGVVSGGFKVDEETGWFGSTQTRFEMTARLRDQTESTVEATTSFIFSRWNVGIGAVGGRIHPKRPLRIHAVGYTGSVGRPLYAHWSLGGKRVFTKRLGVLRGPCGDLRTRLSRGFPFRPVRPGTYDVTFNASRTNPRTKASILHRSARVARRIP